MEIPQELKEAIEKIITETNHKNIIEELWHRVHITGNAR